MSDSNLPSSSRRRRVTSAHVIALILGGSGLLLSRGINTTGTVAYALPIVSGVLFALFLTSLIPRWVAAIVPVAVTILAFVNVHNVAARQRARAEAMQLGYALADVCRDKPLGRDPNGPRVRVFEKHDGVDHWQDLNIDATEVPTYVLCIAHRSENVSCGDYVSEGRADGGSRHLCSTRDTATAELRRAKTAEVVFSKGYRGGDPRALNGYVQLGGAGSTRLSGDAVSYEAIHADVKALLEQP